MNLHTIVLGNPSAPPLVILHGWRQSLESMKPLGELLAGEHCVHLIDLPGFGQSDPPPEGWGTGEYAERIEQYLDSKGIARADFIGHSFGGKVSMKLAGTRPERVSRIVLINSSGVRARPPWKRALKIRFVKMLRWTLRKIQDCTGVRWYETWFIPRFASADYKAAGPLRSTFVKIVNEDLTVEARAIRAPALLLWGQNDTETPVAVGQLLSHLISGSQLIVLEGKDHFAFSGSGASLCAYHIRKFYQSHNVAAES